MIEPRLRLEIGKPSCHALLTMGYLLGGGSTSASYIHRYLTLEGHT